MNPLNAHPPLGPGNRSGRYPPAESAESLEVRRAACLLLAALLLTVLEGALRKWVIGSEAGKWSYVAYFSKDIAFLALLLVPGGAEPAALRTFWKWLVPGSALLIGGALLSAMKGCNPVGAALTLRAAIGLPLIACLAVRRLTAFRTPRAALLLAWLTFANFGLGVLQNRLPRDHVLNRYALGESVITAAESGVRATGTFSYITGMALMAVIGIWSGLVLLSTARDRWPRVLGAAAVIAGFGCGLASVSRGPIVIGGFLLLSWVLATRGTSVTFKTLGTFVSLPILLIGLGVLPTLHELGRGVLERHATGGDSFRGRVLGQLEQAVEALAAAPLGEGLGTEQVAGNYAAGGVMKFTTYEEQLPRLVLETGVFGLAGFLLTCAGALLALETARRASPDPGERAMYRVTQVLMASIFYTNIVFNHTASAFAWILFAAVLGASPPPAPTLFRIHAVKPIEGRPPGRARVAA